MKSVALFIRAVTTSPLADVDLPLCGGAGSPNRRGGGVGRRPAVVFTSSWSRAVGSWRLWPPWRRARHCGVFSVWKSLSE
jgi:hypothetical protein